MQKAIYITVRIDELLPHVQALKGAGARFVQMHAERCVDDGSYRLVYTFINVRAAQEQIARDGNYAIENLVVEGIDQCQEIPSISSYYPAVFPFENEAHDLFGLAITDMQIDFKGFFYQVSTAEPMSVITPEVKAAREKAMKVRAAAEAKARKAAAEKAAAAAAAANKNNSYSGGSSSGGGSYATGTPQQNAGSGKQQAVVNACYSTPSPGQNWCAAWVTNVFRNAGVGYFGGNACDMFNAWCYSSDRSALQVGMIVADSSHSGTGAPGLIYGHVGIYVGGGIVMSNEGAITSKSLDSFISFYGTGSGVRWGWLGGIVLS